MGFLSTVINNEFKIKIEYILKDINMYMNVVFNFLYINKLFYLNLRSLRENFISLNKVISKKLRVLNSNSLLNKAVKTTKKIVIFN
jgi:hypothetical protein